MQIFHSLAFDGLLEIPFNRNIFQALMAKVLSLFQFLNWHMKILKYAFQIVCAVVVLWYAISHFASIFEFTL